jgi:hypothetical protein
MLSVANTYGGTAHLSPLLRKVKRLGLPTADSLLRLAVKRGCGHYAPADYEAAQVIDPGFDRLTDAELGIAMISGAQDYDPQRIRCAVQLLSGHGIDAGALMRLAKMERCEPLLAYIADQAKQWDKDREAFWVAVAAMLPRHAGQPIEAWPHPSRFMLQAGYRRGGGVHQPVWLRPRPRAPVL